MSFLPSIYFTWGLARVLYFIGYLFNGPCRMIGFPGTVMPTAALLAYVLYIVSQQGLGL